MHGSIVLDIQHSEIALSETRRNGEGSKRRSVPMTIVARARISFIRLQVYFSATNMRRVVSAAIYDRNMYLLPSAPKSTGIFAVGKGHANLFEIYESEVGWRFLRGK